MVQSDVLGRTSASDRVEDSRKAADNSEPSKLNLLSLLSPSALKNSRFLEFSDEPQQLREPGIEKKDGKVVRVTYEDGKSRLFDYDLMGRLTAVRQPNGVKWTRDGNEWKSSDGKSFRGKIDVGDDGEYSFTDRDGLKRIYDAKGSKTLQDKFADLLKAQIEAQRQSESKQTYLAKGIDFLWRKDQNSLQEMEHMHRRLQQMLSHGDEKALLDIRGAVIQSIIKNRDALEVKSEINYYGSSLVKTGFLFLGGNVGLAGTMASYALDQARPSDSLKTQLLDGTLGAAKGGLLKGTFSALGKTQAGIAAKGIGLGMASRALDSTLTRETYYDAKTGQYSVEYGLNKAGRTVFDTKAMAVDVAVFGLAHGLSKGANLASGGVIERSPMLNTMLTGTTFGFSSGATSEILRQQGAGESFDMRKVMIRGGLQAAVNTVAAIPGGIQADPRVREVLKTQGKYHWAALNVEMNAISSDVQERNTASREGWGKDWEVQHHQWGHEFYVARSEAELNQLKQNLSGDASRRVADTYKGRPGTLYSTGDGKLVRVAEGDQVMKVKVNRNFTETLPPDEMWSKYYELSGGTVAGSMLRLMESIANPGHPRPVYSNEFSPTLFPTLPKSIPAKDLIDFHFNKLPEVQGTVNLPTGPK
jgi:YD repeat-containing protein